MLMVHNVASEMHCPLTKELFVDPVLTTAGNTYERKAIEAWLKDHDTSPSTGKTLPHKTLVPNHALRSAYLGLRGGAE